MTAAFIINPAARAGKGQSQKLADALAGKPGLRREVLDNFGDLPDILKSLGEAGFETLFISSGDGTVQAIQTLLAENNWFEKLPRLALLAHGSTNMNASSLGFSPLNLDRILEVATSESYLTRATHVKHRHTIRVVNPRNKSPQHGMFIGAAAIWRATQYCQNVIHQRGLRGEMATFATLVSIVARYFLRLKSDDEDAVQIIKPYDMRIVADDELMVDTPQFAFLATTLDNLILRARPFWGEDNSEMRITAIDYPPPSIAANLLKVMYGIPNRNLPGSCRSRAVNSVEITTRSSFVIDGEFFDPPDNASLLLERGPQFSYLCG